MLSIRQSPQPQRRSEDNAWQGGRCVPGTSPADQAQAASRQCLPHQQNSRVAFFKFLPPEAEAELAEAPDAIVELGLKLGGFQGGRGRLPLRLQAGRLIRGGALGSKGRPAKPTVYCAASLCDPLLD